MKFIQPIIWIAIISYMVWQGRQVIEVKAWQTNWEQEGMLPLDKVQNSRLDNIEKQLRIEDVK